MSTFLLIAKAGGSGEAPENTCEAIRRVVELRPPADIEMGLEIDLRLSNDERFVAVHDAHLERTTNGRGLVRERGVRELCRLRAGPDGERVPDLQQVLEAAGSLPLVLELHDDDVVAAAALGRELLSVPRQRRESLCIASEHGRVVDALRRREPTLRTAATKHEAWSKLLLGWLGLARFAARGHVWIVPERHAGLQVVTPRFVAAAGANGDAVWTFVVDDATALHRLRAWGVSGCLTTRPSQLLAEMVNARACSTGAPESFA